MALFVRIYVQNGMELLLLTLEFFRVAARADRYCRPTAEGPALEG